MTEVISCVFCNSKEAFQFRTRADIVKCFACDLVYLRTRPTVEAMYEIYQVYANDTSHMRPPGSVLEARKSGLRRQYFVDETISYLETKKETWLDIGCGWGALLDYSRELGFLPRGIELTRKCLDFATMQLGIPVSNAQFTDSQIADNSCSVVSMVHVLEHIPNPKEAIGKIYKILQPGGIFSGIIPNIESLCSETLKEDWVWLDPTHHYVHYSPKSIKNKLEEAGFVIKKIYTSVGDYDHDAFLDCIRTQFALQDPVEIAKKVQTLEEMGKGEEIRFFAFKPA